MSIEVADLVAKLGLDAAAYNVGLTAAEARAQSGAATMRLAFGGIGLAAAVGLAEAVKSAVKFESQTQTLANNTNMGAAGLAQMRQGVLELARTTGQPLESLSQGWMHIANHAYDGAAAMNIASAAAKNAAATGGDAGNDMNVLAGIMREYGVSARQAGQDTGLATRYMDVLHNAVANSNFTMNDFVEGGKRAFAQAGAFGVPIAQVSAQLAVLSEHGFPNARVAGLNWAGMLRSLESPTHAARRAMQSLSATTGVNLVADIKKLQQNGAFLPQFLADIQKATGGDFNKVRAIMPQSSYATALEGLLRNLKDVQRVQALTDAAQAGRKAPGMVGTNEAFAAWSTTVDAQMKILHGTFSSLSVQIGSVFLPALNRVLQVATPFIQTVATWVGHHQRLSAALLGGVAALGLLTGGMALLGAVSAPLAALVGAISFPLLVVAAASAALALAWTHDWGGIREKTAQAWAAIQPVLRAVQSEFRLLGTLFKVGGIGLSWQVFQIQVENLVRGLGTWIRSVGAPALVTHLQSWAMAFWAWVRAAVPPLLRELGNMATRLWGWVRSVVPPLVRELGVLAGHLWSWVSGVVPPLLRELGALAGRLWGWVTAQSAPLRTRLMGWATAFWAWVAPATLSLLAHLGPLLNRLGAWIGAQLPVLGRHLQAWGAAFWGWITVAGPRMLRELGQLTGRLFVYVTAASLTLAAQLAKWGVALVGWIAPRLGELTDTLARLIVDLGTWIITVGVPSMAKLGLSLGTSLLGGIKDGLAGAVGDISSRLGGAASGLFGQPGAPGASAPALGGRGANGHAPSIVNVHITPGSVPTASGGSVGERAAGLHIGRAVDEALRQLAGAGGGGQGGHRLLPGQS